MPIREYSATDPKNSCAHCKPGFERVEPMECPPFPLCPECGNKVERQLSATNVGGSKSNSDDRAKSAGFQKFEKLGNGEYEKKY